MLTGSSMRAGKSPLLRAAGALTIGMVICGCGPAPETLPTFGDAGDAADGGPSPADDAAPDASADVHQDGAPPAHDDAAAADALWDPVDLTGAYDIAVDSTVLRFYLRRSSPGRYEGRFGNQSGGGCQMTPSRAAVAVDDPGSCRVINGDFLLGQFEPAVDDYGLLAFNRSPDGAIGETADLTRTRTRTPPGEPVRGAVSRASAPPILEVNTRTLPKRRPLMPWQPLHVGFGSSDAVDRDELPRLLTVKTDRAPQIAPRLSLSPDAGAPGAWLGVTTMAAAFAWDDVSGALVTLEIAPGLRDFGGLVATALSATVAVVNVGPALALHTFDGSSAGPALWGMAALSAPAGGDPACDTGTGCLVLGPEFLSCEGAGVAGLVTAPAGVDHITLRYRIVTPAPRPDAGASSSNMDTWIVAFTEDGGTDRKLVPFPAATIELAPSAESPAGWWASAWTTFDLALPAGGAAARWGFEVWSDGACPHHTSPSVSRYRLVIDSVSAN